MSVFRKWQRRAQLINAEAVALYFACRDPRTPWYAKAIGFCVVAYALSPIDLIPDPIPLLGYVDDLILIPLGIALTAKLIPAEVLAEHRARTHEKARIARRAVWIVAIVIICLWIVLILLLILLLKSLLS